ncbi:MAG: Lrp/AsnC family transcriptional regulator [Spirochaetes bacterium]|nr:MAG: Lrp/AsnC family transcriptional regulator [Spirochaetota bacterium]
MSPHFTRTQELILNRIQRDMPLSADPYAGLAAELGLDIDELLAEIRTLKSANVIRRISAIFSAQALGYSSSLVAFCVPGEEADEAARIINAHPGVSHNYLRGHRYNIWFTLAVPPGQAIEDHAGVLARRCGARDFLVLKNEEMFKIGVMLAVGDAEPEDAPLAARPGGAKNTVQGEDEVLAVTLLQTDLPVVKNPFARLAAERGVVMDPGLLAQTGESFKERGIMRRYAAVLRHQNAGYRANAMTAWKLPVAREAELVSVFEKCPHITHLYRRTVFPGRWEHPLFAMIHAKSDGELEGIIGALARESGLDDYLVLKSLKEYQKRRVMYFTPDFGKWAEKYLSGV